MHTKTAHTAGRRDLQHFSNFLGTHSTNSRKGTEHLINRHLCKSLVVIDQIEYLTYRQLTGRKCLLNFLAASTGKQRLFTC